MIHLLSLIIFIALLYGRWLRHKNIKTHAAVMTAVIVADISLVSYLTFARNALSKVSPDMSLGLMIHIPIAILTVVFYLVALYVGWRLLKGEKQWRRSMRRIDRVVVPLRLLTLITSFLVYLGF